MKRSLFCLLFALVLMVGLLTVSVGATEDTGTEATHADHCVCGGKANGVGDHVCGEAVTGWTAFSTDLFVATSDSNRVNLPAGNYYLAGDITISKEMNITPDTEVTFCLNGHTLTGTRRIFRVNGVLNICDCSQKGTGTANGTSGNGPVFYGYSGGHINLFGGTLTSTATANKNWGGVGALATDAGTAATKGSSSMTMYSGVMDASGATLVKTSEGKHGSGGALIMMGTKDYPATFEMYGGTIIGAKSVAVNGAAISTSADDTVKILGGTVKNGSAKGVGNGVAPTNGATIVIGGDCNIEELYLRSGQSFTTENLTGSVGLATAEAGLNKTLTTVTSAEEGQCFVSKMQGRSLLVNSNNQVRLIHCRCGGNLDPVAAKAVGHNTCAHLTFKALTTADVTALTQTEDSLSGACYVLPAGNYYLTEDITIPMGIQIAKDTTVNLDLNGHTLAFVPEAEVTSKRAMAVRGNLNLSDSAYDPADPDAQWGKVTGARTDQAAQAMYVNSDAKVFIYGGELACGYTEGTNNGPLNMSGTVHMVGGQITGIKTNKSGAAVVLNDSSSFTLWGGRVVAGKTTQSGGAFYVSGTAPKLYVKGGEITGGNLAEGEVNAKRGGAIYLAKGTVEIHAGIITGCKGNDTGGGGGAICQAGGSLTISGGTISNSTHNKAGGGVYVAPGLTFTMTGGTVTDCTAGYGGSIGSLSGILNISGGTISNGTATTTGGGNLFLQNYESKGGELNLSGTVRVLDGTASKENGGTGNGGNIYNYGATLNITGGTVSGGHADNEGGNIYASSNVTISGGTITLGNTDAEIGAGGGNIRATAGTLSISGTAIISQGNANTVGGNIYAKTVQMSGGTVTKGKSAVQGGNFYLVSGYKLNISDGIVSDGVGSSGGNIAAYAKGTDAVITISGGTISNGTAVGGGGGNIYLFPEAGDYKNAILNITGGEILGGTGKSGSNGGSIRANNNTSVVVIGTKDSETGPLISGGYATNAYGGILYTSGGSITMYSGTITNGRDGVDNAQKGGAFYISDAGTLTIEGGLIDGCVTSGDGGNIYSINSNVKMTGGTVQNGKSTAGGGGNFYVTVDNTTEVTMEILGGTISGGTTEKSGGNLRVNSGYVTLVIGEEGKSGPTISGGMATGDGGNLYSAANPATIYSGTFSHGLEEGVANAQKGGGIYIASGSMEIKDVIIDGCISGKTGGGGIYHNSGSFTMSGGTVRNCKATAGGGGLFIASGRTFEMTGGTIENCQAVYGGNVYGYGATLNISGGTISGGIATAAQAAGGNINIEKKDDSNVGTLNLSGTATVTGGQATVGNGGNICINGATAYITGGTVSGGIAEGEKEKTDVIGGGGNIYNGGTLVIGAENTEGPTITGGRTPMGRGGSIYNDGTLTMYSGNLLGGLEAGVGNAHRGGNIYSAGDVTITGGTISGGQSSYGGNLYLDLDCKATISGCTISDGVANLKLDGSTNGNGGNIYAIKGSDVTISGCTFIGGKAIRAGSVGIWGKATIENTTITGGEAQAGGGNLMGFGSGVTLTVKDTTITGGKVASGRGGNVLFSGEKGRKFTIGDGVIVDNGTASTANTQSVAFSGGQLTLEGTPDIATLYIDVKDDAFEGVNTGKLSVADPIPLYSTASGEFGIGSDVNVFVNPQGYVLATRDGKLYLDAPVAVYVSDNGDDNNNGSQENPYKTLNRALSMLADNGTVYIKDILTQSTHGTGAGGWAEHGKTFTLTGGEFVTPVERIMLRDNVTFDNLVLQIRMSETITSSNYGNFFFYCNGFTTVFTESVTTKYTFLGEELGDPYHAVTYTPKDKEPVEQTAYSKLYGGSNASGYGKLTTDTNLTVLGGVWGEIYGGSNRVDLDANVHLTVGGRVNEGVDYVSHTHSGRHVIYGGNDHSNISGTVYMNVIGGQNHTTTMGGSNGTCSIGAVELHATGGNGMAIYGGAKNGVNTIGTINFYYEGATFEQVFGGSLSQSLVVTDALNLYVTGGTITRRLYGGCYSNCDESSGNWTADNFVTGNVNLYIGSGANITCDLKDPNPGFEAILTGGKYADRGIYGHSRRENPNASDAENASIIFLDKDSYDKHKGNLKAQDSIMSGIMRGVTAADYICYLGTNVDGKTITVGATEVEDYANNALDLPSSSVTLNVEDSYIYKGQAIEPGYTLDGAAAEDVTVTYVNNNQAGTGTVTLSYGGQTLTFDFTIVDGKVATVGGTVYYSLQDALNAAGEMGLVVLQNRVDEEGVTVSVPVYLNLNGYSIVKPVTVAEGVTLYGMDSTTDDYDCADGFGTMQVTGAGNVAVHHKTEKNGSVGKILRYLTHTDSEGNVSFHRIYLGITQVTIKTGSKGIGYKAVFGGDEIVKSMLDENTAFGYRLQLEGQDAVVSRDGTREEFVTGSEGTRVGLTVSNYDMNYAEKVLSAWVTLTLSDGTVISADGTTITEDNKVITSSVYEFTFRSILDRINAQFSSYTTEQMEYLKGMISGLAENLQTWGLTNLYDLVTPAVDPATPAPEKEEI